MIHTAVVVAIVLAGCGGDDDVPAGAGGTGTPETTVAGGSSGSETADQGSGDIDSTGTDSPSEDGASGEADDLGSGEDDSSDADAPAGERPSIDGFRRVPDPCALLEWSEVEAWTSLTRMDDEPELLEQTMGTLTCVWATELDPDELIARGISVSVMETEPGGSRASQIVEATQQVMGVEITADISRVPGRPFADEIGQFGTILDEDLVVTVGSYALFDQLDDGFDVDDQDLHFEILRVVLDRVLG